jgi:hypothetical protein
MGLRWKPVDGVEQWCWAGVSAVLDVVQFTKRGGVSDVFIVAVTSRERGQARDIPADDQ